MPNYTISGEINAWLGEVSKVRATVHANSTDEGYIADADEVILGGGLIPVANDGTFSVSLPSTASTDLQYEVRAEYVDNATRQRKTWRSGWNTLTANVGIGDFAESGSLNVTPARADVIEDRLDALEAGAGDSEILDALAARIDGVQDHGDVTGTLTVDPANGYHVFDATGPTEVSLGAPPGYSVAFKAITGADDVTVDGLADLTLTDDAWATFVHYRDAWHLAASGASGGGDVEPVVDPPTQPGAITVDPTADGYNLSWVASTVAAGYEVQIDGGSWVDSGANLTHAHTGLSAGSEHSGAVRAYNSVGERSTARAWGPVSTDTLGFHDVIMATEAAKREVYLRATDGTLRDYSRVTGTWSEVSGLTAGDHTGRALTPGDTSSFRFPPNSQLTRALDGLMVGSTSFTVMIVLGAPADVTTGSNGISYNNAQIKAGWDDPVYYSHRPGGVHSWVLTWDGTTMTRYFENTTSGEGIFFGQASPLAAPSTPELLIHGSGFGGYDNDGGELSHLIVWKDVILTTDQRTGLVTSASTVDNTATGG